MGHDGGMTEHTDPTNEQQRGPEQAPDTPEENVGEGEERRPKVVMSSTDGVSMADPDEDPTAAVEEPAKVMRIGMMLKQLLEEVKSAPLDEAARDRLAEVHARSVAELRTGLSEELADELARITLPFSDDAAPSDAELRVAQAQLVGWLEGLFHGIQTALVAQQMMAQNQLASMRRALPRGGMGVPGQGMPGMHPSAQRDQGQERPGQYL